MPRQQTRVERRTLDALLERVYPLPSASDAGERFFCTDLGARNADDLKVEREQIRLRLFLDPAQRPSWWLLRRLECIEEELQR